MKKSENSKIKSFKFQVINIKLQTKKVGVEKETAYADLIRKMKDEKIHSSVAENMHMIIYSFFERVTPVSQIEYLYGNLGKGIYFEEDLIDSLNIEKSEGEKQQSNKNQILDPKMGQYIFVPKIHRLIYINKSGISINNIHKFLKDSLSKVADKEDIVEIEIAKDPKITDEILKAYEIHSLDYEISYTNDDPTSSVEKLLDERLKKLFAGKLNVKIEADHNGHLNMTEPDELVEGGVKLAEQNGQVNEAVITRKPGGKRIKLSNRESARKFDVECTEENLKESIIGKVFSIFNNIL
jgi:hypothetical protein